MKTYEDVEAAIAEGAGSFDATAYTAAYAMDVLVTTARYLERAFLALHTGQTTQALSHIETACILSPAIGDDRLNELRRQVTERCGMCGGSGWTTGFPGRERVRCPCQHTRDAA